MKKIIYFILLLLVTSCKDEEENVEPSTEPVAEFQQLTNYPEGVGSVVISEDGRTIFYTVSKNRDSMGNYNVDLYSMNSDGSNQKKVLGYVSATGTRLVLSKNNKQMAFIFSKNTNTSSGPERALMVGNFDGTGLRSIPLALDGNEILAAFVDNDQSLLYTKSGVNVNGCGCNTTWKLNLNDSSTKMLSGNGWVKAVSKDRSIALVENDSEAFTMDSNGQSIIQLGNKFVPWDISPDKSTIVMHKIMPWSNGKNTVQMFISNSSGSSNLQLTNAEGTSLPHGFFPSGQEILFKFYPGSSGQGDAELYSIKPDGTELIRLTNNNVEEAPIGFLEKSRKVLVVLGESRAQNLYVLNLK